MQLTANLGYTSKLHYTLVPVAKQTVTKTGKSVK